MKHLLSVALVLLVACSAESDPECIIDGTYSVTSTRESGDCGGSTGEAVTDTFTTLSDGRVKLEIQGLPDLTPIGTVSGCQWTAANKFTVVDATGPEKSGTLQYSYTFTRTGLTGFVSLSVPPSQSLPGGCRGTARTVGTRR